LKAAVKTIETEFLNILKNDIDSSIEVLFYSVLTPLDAILNKAIKTSLAKISSKYNHVFETIEFLKQKEHLKK